MPQTKLASPSVDTEKQPDEKTQDEKRPNNQLASNNNKTGWISYLPRSWIPFVQLTRLYHPAPLFLIFLPHFFGILCAAILQKTPWLHTLRMSAVLLGGSFFFSNAVHIWDDLIDAPLDTLVKRTCNRPIPRGAVSPRAAFIFTVTQAIGALVFFIGFPNPVQAIFYALPNILASAYYPYAKRHTNFPQLVLGFCLSYGTLIGGLAMGMKPFTISTDFKIGAINAPVIYLFLAGILWPMIFDTVYAHLDVECDINLGIGSTAVLFGDRTKPFLWVCFALMQACLIESGRVAGQGLPYFAISVGGSAISLGLMIACVDFKQPSNVGWWFGTGFWYTGGCIAGGLLMEYLSVLGFRR